MLIMHRLKPGDHNPPLCLLRGCNHKVIKPDISFMRPCQIDHPWKAACSFAPHVERWTECIWCVTHLTTTTDTCIGTTGGWGLRIDLLESPLISMQQMLINRAITSLILLDKVKACGRADWLTLSVKWRESPDPIVNYNVVWPLQCTWIKTPST